MTSDPLALVFLGAIALSSLVQAALLVALAIALYRLGRRADAFGQRVQEELRPHLERAAEIGTHVEQVTEAAARQLPELELTVQETARRVRHAGEAAERLFVRPLAAGALALAVFRAFRSVAGAGAFLKLRKR